MRKYFSSVGFKKQVARRQASTLIERVRFKKHLRTKHIIENLPNPDKKKAVFADYFKSFKKIIAPSHFSIIKNSEEVIKFFNILNDHFERKKKVFVIMQNIESLDYATITVLLSIMIKFKTNRIEFNGDFPVDFECSQMLRQCGFLDYVGKKYLPDSDRFKFGKLNSIHTHALKRVDSKLGATIILHASEKIWKEKRRCQGLQRTLIELMMNTNNHASNELEGVKHWWLSANYDENSNLVQFCFLDLGVGVFNSLAHKDAGNKFYGWRETLKGIFKFNTNADVLELILNGDLHKTVTEKDYRGKGLPGIKEALDRDQLSNLHVITNNVWANIKAGEYKVLDNNFAGTFLYFELNEKNLSYAYN